MATLNTTCGWVDTDPSNVLMALGIGVTKYGVDQITICMNDLCDFAPQVVGSVQDLLDQYETAQATLAELNASSNGKTLVKADVLEWKESAPGASYSPERELMRIKQMIMMYFAACPVCGGSGYIAGGTSLVRS